MTGRRSSLAKRDRFGLRAAVWRVVPNLISIGRIGLVPVSLYFLLTGAYSAALAAFVIASVSDAADGYIARRWDLVTPLGKLLDPLADKALLAGMTIALGWLGLLPIWLVVVIVSRDVLIIAGVTLTWLLRRPIAAAPSMVSKTNTVAQLALCTVILFELVVGFTIPALHAVLIGAVLVLTVISAIFYARQWAQHMGGRV